MKIARGPRVRFTPKQVPTSGMPKPIQKRIRYVHLCVLEQSLLRNWSGHGVKKSRFSRKIEFGARGKPPTFVDRAGGS